MCVGCRRGLSNRTDVVTCHFAHRGFPFPDGSTARVCGSAYHASCIQAGLPFTTRRVKDAGLAFPRVTTWPIFICEACTVRSVLQRELHGLHDWQLMCLERMRILDIAHAWALGTHSQYQSKFRVLQQFGRAFSLPFFGAPTLVMPPRHREIPLMWAHEFYSLVRSPSARNNDLPVSERPTITHGTIRQLRSAAAQYESLTLLITEPGRLMADKSKSVWISDCRYTDSYSFTLFAGGMSSRSGTTAKPSMALLDRHVRWLDADLDRRYRLATTPLARLELARAGLLNLVLWLGWLRSAEAFNTTLDSTIVILPRDGPTVDLPKNIGLLLLQLLPETKSSRSITADVVIAFSTVSGYHPGLWYRRMAAALGLTLRDCREDSRYLFCTPTGTKWTSKYFRDTYLYPALEAQRLAGDPILRAFDGSIGNTLQAKFWSLHCYRRGSRTHVSRKNPRCYRRATEAEIYEHARWRRRRQSEAIDVIYREWGLRDRVKLTLYAH
jgi:hypothetical protein